MTDWARDLEKSFAYRIRHGGEEGAVKIEVDSPSFATSIHQKKNNHLDPTLGIRHHPTQIILPPKVRISPKLSLLIV